MYGYCVLALKLGAKDCMARPITTSYSDEERLELIKRICVKIIQTNVEKACKSEGIDDSTFYAWVASDDALADEYARARAIISYKGEAELEKISRMAMDGECDPKAANVASQNTRWLMGRRNPKVYGDKIQNEISGKDGGKIEQEMTIKWADE